jgi:integrase
MKLTDRLARSLGGPTEGKTEIVYWDDQVRRFGLRVRAQGGRRWIVDYEPNGGRGSRRVTLGDPSVVTCAAARQKARELRAKASLGEDPQGDRLAARKAITFGERVEDYLAETAHRLRPATRAMRSRYLTLHAKPLHRLVVGTITRGDLLGLLTSIAKERGEVAANRCGSALVGYFAWLMLSGVIDANPMIGIKAFNETSRDRVLTDNELAAIWHATDNGTSFDRIVRLLMLTACRRAEVGSMRWSEITGDMFTLPAARSKNNVTHEVPLHPLAIAQLPPRSGNRDVVFGRGGNDTGYASTGRSKERLDRRVADSLTAAWTLHDLRRTCATWLSEHDTDPHVVEAVLGHVGGTAKKGVAGIYNRAAYRVQKREALARWAEHVAEITGQSIANVAVFARG